MKQCIGPNNTINFSINVGLHVFILFCFLSVFFIFYVSKLETSVIDSEFKSLIDTYLTQSLNDLPQTEKTQLKATLKKFPLESLIKIYEQPDQAVVENNKWLFRMIIAINIFLFILITGAILLLYFTCNRCLPIGRILIENIIIFTFVGTIEFLFFRYVAIRYIPAPPSMLIDSVISETKNII